MKPENIHVKEKGHFFNEAQKNVKGEIMDKLISGFFDTLTENQKLFQDTQSIIDLFGSILIMFNRELIVNLLMNLGISDQGSKLMRNIFDVVHQEVTNKIKENKN